MKQIIRELGARLMGREFSATQLARIMKHDGGHDMSNLSLTELESLIEGTFTGDWRKPAFSCSELLTYYEACDGKLHPPQVVGWACASILLSEAARKGKTDWDSQFDFLIDSFLSVRDFLETGEAIQIFEEVFRK